MGPVVAKGTSIDAVLLKTDDILRRTKNGSDGFILLDYYGRVLARVQLNTGLIAARHGLATPPLVVARKVPTGCPTSCQKSQNDITG